jgi:bacillithiol system protein YtxJ
MNQWNNVQELDDFLHEKGTALIFKHSTSCGVSSEAASQIEKVLESHPDIPVYRVLVIENRATSTAITDRLGVVHASPQVILLRDGKTAWKASHWDITESSLAEAWATVNA